MSTGLCPSLEGGEGEGMRKAKEAEEGEVQDEGEEGRKKEEGGSKEYNL